VVAARAPSVLLDRLIQRAALISGGGQDADPGGSRAAAGRPALAAAESAAFLAGPAAFLAVG